MKDVMANEKNYLGENLEQILIGVQNGDAESFERLCAKYEPLIVAATKSFEGGESSKSDLEREAQSALLKAAVRFDTNQSEVAFGLYAKICIKNALISLKRKEAARQRRAAKTSGAKVSAVKARISFSGDGADAEKLVESVNRVLSAYEKRVFSEYMSGKSAAEIAVELGKDVKSVNNAIYRIKEKAQKVAPK